MMQVTKCKTDREQFQVGDNVKTHDVERGWMFGRVIGIHFDDASQVWCATVRWIQHGDMAHPQFRLESYHGEPKFSVGDSVAFTHLHSHTRIGNVLRRWWAGAWCYAVSDPNAGWGEWILGESSLTAAE